jgi:uncharacterized membrane protein
MEFLSNLHPQFVHFPIAIFILYGIAEITGIVLNKEFVSKTAFLLLFVGILFSIFAVLTGNKAADRNLIFIFKIK